jgi:hypothetical protein
VLGVEVVSAGAAVGAPEVIKVQLCGGAFRCGEFRWECLPVDGAVLFEHQRRQCVRGKLGWNVRAVVTRDHEDGSELIEEGLLGSIGEAIVIGVCVLSAGTDRTDGADDQEKDPDSSHIHLDALFAGRARDC